MTRAKGFPETVSVSSSNPLVAKTEWARGSPGRATGLGPPLDERRMRATGCGLPVNVPFLTYREHVFVSRAAAATP